MQSVKKVVEINGTSVSFNRLSLEDLFGISETLASNREKTIRALGKEEKLDKYEMSNLLLSARTNKASINEIYASCDTPQGATLILKESLKKSGVAADKHSEVIAGMRSIEAIDLAKLLVADVPEEKEESNEDEVPLEKESQ